MLLDHNGVYIGIGYNGVKVVNPIDVKEAFFCSGLTEKIWFTKSFTRDQALHVCLINDCVYIIDLNLQMIEFNTTNRTQRLVSKLNESSGYGFDNLQLLNFGEKLLLCQKLEKKIHSYDFKAGKWSPMCDFKTPKDLIAISSNYSSIQSLKMLFTSK